MTLVLSLGAVKATVPVGNRITYTDAAFAEEVVWHGTQPVARSLHSYKYRLALFLRGVCVLRYDNESGKRTHRHTSDGEGHHRFTSLDRLFAGFERDVRVLDEDGHA